MLEGWIAEYGSELRVHLSRMVGDDDAEDVLQSVWMKVHDRGTSPEAPGKVRAWLYRVATNAALDRLRIERRRAKILEDHARGNPHPVTSEAPRALDEGTRQRIREACARLPRKQRDAVWHRWIEEEDYQTVAERLGSDVPTVRANVYHGLKRLRRELADVWQEEGFK